MEREWVERVGGVGGWSEWAQSIYYTGEWEEVLREGVGINSYS